MPIYCFGSITGAYFIFADIKEILAKLVNL